MRCIAFVVSVIMIGLIGVWLYVDCGRKPIQTKFEIRPLINNSELDDLKEVISLKFSKKEYRKVKSVIEAFCNSENILKPIEYDAVNQAIFFMYQIDDNTFIDRLEQCGLLEITGNYVSGVKLKPEIFTSIIIELSKSDL